MLERTEYCMNVEAVWLNPTGTIKNKRHLHCVIYVVSMFSVWTITIYVFR